MVDIYSTDELKKVAKDIFEGAPMKKYMDPVFRLHPPRKGLKNIKKAYPMGALGKRDDMDEFIKRMS